MPNEPDKAEMREIGYRNGYHHGYVAAITDLQNMLQSGVSINMALRRMVDHAQSDNAALKRWRYGFTGKMIFPPSLE